MGCENRQSKIVELTPIDSLGWNDDECTFKQVTDMVQIGDELFISDLLTSEINVFSAEGFKHKRCISTKGEGPQETNMPLTLIARNGNIIVSDFINSRVKELDVEGNIISNITGIRAYDLFQIGSETIVRTYHSSLELCLLHKLQGDSLQSYLKPDVFFNKYLKPENGGIPWYVMNMTSEKIIYAFHNSQQTTLCLDVKSGEISEWSGITNSKDENVYAIMITKEFAYLLLKTVKDQTSGLEPARLVKKDFSGNVVSSAILLQITPADFIHIDGDQLYLFDNDTATIKLFDLKGL